MSSIEEAVNNTGIVENEFNPGNVVNPVPSSPLSVNQQSGLTFDISLLFTPAEKTPIADYVNHSLNFLQSQGLAQMLRAVTAFAKKLTGEGLDYAIVDLVVGILNFIKERRVPQENGNF